MLNKSGSPRLHTLGFGSVYDDQTLSGISEEGRGHCMYIQDAEAIPGAFAAALGGLMSVVSQNLELTFAPQVIGNCWWLPLHYAHCLCLILTFKAHVQATSLWGLSAMNILKLFL